ncbi:hypothetical protein EGT35_04990 [Francisella tularensis]|nr:hypothetical protein EGT35_04990 [Francisella tularensis]
MPSYSQDFRDIVINKHEEGMTEFELSKFFESKWGNVGCIKNIDHTLTKEIVEEIIRKDIDNLRKEVFGELALPS